MATQLSILDFGSLTLEPKDLTRWSCTNDGPVFEIDKLTLASHSLESFWLEGVYLNDIAISPERMKAPATYFHHSEGKYQPERYPWLFGVKVQRGDKLSLSLRHVGKETVGITAIFHGSR